jgi:hypothetical protein
MNLKKIPFIKGSLEEFEIFEGKLVELTGQLFRNCEVTSGTVEPKEKKVFTDNKSNSSIQTDLNKVTVFFLLYC